MSGFSQMIGKKTHNMHHNELIPALPNQIQPHLLCMTSFFFHSAMRPENLTQKKNETQNTYGKKNREKDTCWNSRYSVQLIEDQSS